MPPEVSGDLVVFASCAGSVTACDRATGETRWQLDVLQDGIAQSFHGEMTVVDGILYVASDPDQGHVYALDVVSGDVLWKWASGTGVSSDLLAHDDRLLAVTLDNELVALGRYDGAVLWRTAPTERMRTVVTPTPVILVEDVLFARADGVLSRRHLVDGAVQWERSFEAAVTTDLTLVDEGLVLGFEDRRLALVSPEDGSVLRSVELSGTPAYRWFFDGSGRLIGMTDLVGPQRRLICVDLTTFEILWSAAPPDDQEWTTAQPMLLEDSVLVGTTASELVLVSKSDGSRSESFAVEQPPRVTRLENSHLYVGTYDGMLLVYEWHP